ncbi:hypothetical protein [Halorientalis litorea]|jgi:hypothetical protein|uniref:hypothetical protein n=1 Tax=Halorientalis litorea TaxID=2931977 RepID=UPI001FF3C188|nr:hypothetical protein [Halorientalis litorea]
MSLLDRLRAWFRGEPDEGDATDQPTDQSDEGAEPELDPNNVTEVRASNADGVDPVEQLQNLDGDDENGGS